MSFRCRLPLSRLRRDFADCPRPWGWDGPWGRRSALPGPVPGFCPRGVGTWSFRAILEDAGCPLRVPLLRSRAGSQEQFASLSVELARDLIQIRAQPGGKGCVFL